MKTIFTYSLTILLATMSCFAFGSKENHVLISGTAYEIPDEMSGCDIAVLKNGVPNLYTKSEENGDFSFKLAIGGDYLIEFSREGYITKILNVNTKGVQRSDIDKNYIFEDINIDLFQEIEGLDVSILKRPIAKITYDNKKGEFTYDLTYNNDIQKKVEQLWAEVYNQRVMRDQRYDDKMVYADDKFDLKEYYEARDSYVGALTDRPMAKEPKEKIKLIDDLLGNDDVVIEEIIQTKVEEVEEIIASIEHEVVSMDTYSEETLNKGNKTIFLKKILKDGKNFEFKEVKNIYGQRYFFINDQITTSFIWNTQLAVLRN